MMKIKNKFDWNKIIKNEVVIKRMKLGALFLLGFLVGVMLKSQATRTVVVGFDDHQALLSDEIQLNGNI